MELLFVIVIAAGIGGILRYLLPGRDVHGVLLLPALSAAVAAIVWVALLWAGLTFDGGWIWVASLVAGGLAAVITGLALPRRRSAADEELFVRLSRGAERAKA